MRATIPALPLQGKQCGVLSPDIKTDFCHTTRPGGQPEANGLFGSRLVGGGEEIVAKAGGGAIVLWRQEFNARTMLVDSAVPNIDRDTEPVSEFASSNGQFVYAHHTLPLPIVFGHMAS